jgi:hypothetical protein
MRKRLAWWYCADPNMFVAERDITDLARRCMMGHACARDLQIKRH